MTKPGRSPVPDPPDRHRGDAAATTPAVPDVAGGGPSLSADDLVASTGGKLLRRSSRSVRGGAVDSRLVMPGNLFVALRGERTDGHAYLGAAAAAGAAAFLVVRQPDVGAGEPALESLGDVTVIQVADPLRALHAVAASWRRRFDPLVVGVTGSIAKTSTKEAVAGVLARRFPTLRTEGNQNNEVGMPLTVLRLGLQHGAAVLEMGMYTGGEIRELADIGLPSIGIVTAIQPVHLSRIGSMDAIVDAKAELLEALPDAADGGIAILNADDPLVLGMAGRTRARVVTYGFTPAADVRAADVVSAGFDGMRFRLVTPVGERPVSIGALGRLAIHNGLAAVAAGLAAGMGLDEVVEGLAAASAVSAAPHRSVVIRA
ncbi:MAG: UDP-N-acetylmuramoyl-tripeptide--D-alanyl-D-alanine ligase, partial [Chloroflexi bacterium]|nr:UDP-N-acetylmuramoyl-tripeptide--D-alanyl-D-alanine ligase [Chloroflexota bacterium]